MRGYPVSEQSHILIARQDAGLLAREVGFTEEDAGRLAIIVTELGTNLIKHPGKGELLLGHSHNAVGPCIEILALDHGPGMDLEACLTDGYSTAGTLGDGLGAVRRQATTFDAWTAPGQGTAIHARITASKAAYQSRQTIPWAAIDRAMPGEDVCGDAIAVRQSSGNFVALVADGLGHGSLAAQAAHTAVASFEHTSSDHAEDVVETVHRALRATRGAAVAVTVMDLQTGVATYCGIGNIAGTLQGDGLVRKMTSLNGTAGLVARRVQGFQYPFAPDWLLVMHSDGLSGSWNLDKYPGLSTRDPMLIAAILYRDFSKTRDDATVLVARMVA